MNVNNKEQTHATRKFNLLESAASFKAKVGTNATVREYKNGQFGVRFKIDKSRPKVTTRRIVFTKSNPSDFDSEINGHGTNWHTAEDL